MKLTSIYSDFNAYRRNADKPGKSIFDLLGVGDQETRQTQALAYTLARCPSLLEDIFRCTQIRDWIKRQKLSLPRKVQSIRIDSELTHSAGQERADIICRLNRNHEQSVTLVVEAKRIGGRTPSPDQIAAQLRKYCVFPELTARKPNLIPVAITHDRLASDEFVSITWREIANWSFEVRPDAVGSDLALDFFNYITRDNRMLNFYEVEVLSVPAGNTYEFTERHHIHAHPDRFPYKRPLRIAFRQSGSRMDAIRKIEDIILLDPFDNENGTNLRRTNMKPEIVNRLLGYIDERMTNSSFSNEIYRFYILDAERQIRLPHGPKYVAQNHQYFSLETLLDANRTTLTKADRHTG